MRFHDRVMRVDFSATQTEITNQFFARFKLRARRLIAVEIAHQTKAERGVVHIINVHIAAINLPATSHSHFHLPLNLRLYFACP